MSNRSFADLDIAEVDEALEEQLFSESGAVPVDAESAASLADTAPDPFEELPNRPLKKDEVIFAQGNLSVVNRAAPSQYVRLYDSDGNPRIVLRELAAFALSMVDGKGNRAYHTKPPVERKPNEFRCRAPGCKKLLATSRDRETHEMAYHRDYAAEMEAKKRRKAELTAQRREELLAAALVTILRTQAGQPLEDQPQEIDFAQLGPPSESWSKNQLVQFATRLFPGRGREFIKMPKDQLIELCSRSWQELSGLASDAAEAELEEIDLNEEL